MHLVAAGLTFHSAPLALRERVAIPDSEARQLLRWLVGHAGLRGAAVLSTCNRTEFYVACPDAASSAEVVPRLVRYLDPAGSGEIAAHLVARHDAAAVEQMMRVAAGLDSMVLGEAQVLGQFKAAHGLARDAGTLDAQLDFVMRRAISAAKRVRHETAVGRGAGSLAEVALDAARDLAGLEGRGVLLLGAGKISALAARRLAREGARLYVTSRGGESAQQLAAELGGTAVESAALLEVAADTDVIIGCTASPGHVLEAADVAAVQAQRDHRPLCIVDIAVPRDVDPAAAGVGGVTLLDLDSIGARLATNLSSRRAAIPEAEAIIAAEVVRTADVIGERDATGPTIAALVEHAENLRRAEVERTLAKGPLDAETAERIERLTRSLVRKLLHDPIAHLREHSDDPATALGLREAFGLDDAHITGVVRSALAAAEPPPT